MATGVSISDNLFALNCIEDQFSSKNEGFDSESCINFIKNISKGKNPIHLVSIGDQSSLCAMKIFYFNQKKISSHYTNEYRFHFLNHPNIIKFVGFNDCLESCPDESNQRFRFSYLLFEYAPDGDLTDFIL
jgi:hypothetical protein